MAYNLFYEVQQDKVFDALKRFYTQKGFVLDQSDEPEDEIDRARNDDDALEVFKSNGGWTVLTLDRGWVWQRELRREAQLAVSRQLSCSGFLIRVYDGDYWEYELFSNGIWLDHFVQEVETSEGKPPGTNAGSPAAIVSTFPWLKVDDVVPYLVQENWDDPEERQRLNVPAREGDEFCRFDECSVLDFLRLLGLKVDMIDHSVTLATPVYREFWIKPV